MRPTSRVKLSPRRAPQLPAGFGVVFDRRNAVGELAVGEIKLGRHADIAQPDRPALGVVGRQQIPARPSPPAPPRASSRDRPRRRCRYSCRARRSAKADAPRRRRERRGRAHSVRRRRCAASRCSRPSIPPRSGGRSPAAASAARSTLSGVCLPSVSSAIRRHSPFAGSMTRILAHSPSRSMARKNTPGSLPQRANRSGVRKNKCTGWPRMPCAAQARCRAPRGSRWWRRRSRPDSPPRTVSRLPVSRSCNSARHAVADASNDSSRVR